MAIVSPGGICETLRYPGVAAATKVLTSIPLAADLAVSRIKLRGSGERFILIGYSYGGNLAFDVAHRLIKRGLAVELLVLVDPALTNTTFSINENTVAGHGEPMRGDWRMSAYMLRPIRILLSSLAIVLPDRIRRKLIRRMLYELRVLARHNWKPIPIETQTLHIVSGQLAGAVTEGWIALCPGIQQVFVPGSHIDILRPPGREVVTEAILTALRGVAVGSAR